MSEDGSLPVDDRLANSLVEFDEALAAGADTLALLGAETADDVRERMQGNVECLRLLRRRWALPTIARAASVDAEWPPTIGRFQIRRELGRGGNGVVFLAYDPRLRRQVALKVPRVNALATPELRIRFEQEARATALLDHPNIAAVYEAGQAGPISYIATAYCPGKTLGAWIAESLVPVPERMAARLMISVAEGVQHAHSRGVLHRDLKPSNIILVAGDADSSQLPADDLNVDFIPKVTDFGLAKLLAVPDTAHTQTGAILGSPNYMSPEQAAGRTSDITIATDVYGLGAILYEVLTGRPPIEADGPIQTLRLVESRDPVAPRRLRPELSRDLETICLKCLQKRPHDRYESARALIDDLQRFQAGEPVVARPVGAPERVLRWTRRNPLLATMTTAVATLLLAGVIGSSWAAVVFRNQRDLALDLKTQADGARQAEQAANSDAMAKLRSSHLAQARLQRISGEPGGQFVSLQLLQQAAQIQPGLDLRNEAVACMMTTDLRVTSRWRHSSSGRTFLRFTPHLDRYAECDDQGRVTIHDVANRNEITRLAGNGAPPRTCKFSPSGKYFANCLLPDSIHLWNVDAAKEILKIDLTENISGLWALAFRPDDRMFAYGLAGVTLRLIDLPSGKTREPIKLDMPAEFMAFSPDGSELAVVRAYRGDIRIYAADSGELVRTLESSDEAATDIAWSADGRLIAAGGHDSIARVWDAESGAQRAVLTGHQSVVSACAFHPNGQMLATTGWDDTTRLWSLRTGKQVLKTHGGVQGFDPDGSTMAFIRGPEAGLADVALAEGFNTLYAEGSQSEGPWGLGFAPDGRLLAAASDDGVRLWDLPTRTELACLPLEDGRGGIFIDDGRALITSSKQGLHRWPIDRDAFNGLMRVGPPQRLLASPTGYIAAGGEGSKWLAAVGRSTEVCVLHVDQPSESVPLVGHAEAWTIAISPDGRWAATGTQHGTDILVWDVRRAVSVAKIPARGYGVAVFSPDGKLLATTSEGEPTELWTVGSWKLQRTIDHTGAAAFSHDSRVLALKVERSVKLIDVASGEEIVTLTAPQEMPISDVCFSPDDSQLAVGCYNFNTIQLWDLRQIRRRLATMDLDWVQPLEPDQPQLPDKNPISVPIPLRAEVVPGEL